MCFSIVSVLEVSTMTLSGFQASPIDRTWRSAGWSISGYSAMCASSVMRAPSKKITRSGPSCSAASR
jgi:hypothetical protein